MRLAGCAVDAAGCLAPILGRVIRVGFKDVDEEDIGNRRRIGMEVEACNWLRVTGR